jgi:hypothetical protein
LTNGLVALSGLSKKKRAALGIAEAAPMQAKLFL